MKDILNLKKFLEENFQFFNSTSKITRENLMSFHDAHQGKQSPNMPFIIALVYYYCMHIFLEYCGR